MAQAVLSVINENKKQNTVMIEDYVSLADAATVTFEHANYNAGRITAIYKDASGSVYSGNFNFYRTDGTATIVIDDNSTDFDDAAGASTFNVYISGDDIVVANETGATVTARIVANMYA